MVRLPSWADFILAAMVWLMLVAAPYARNGEEPLNHYALIGLRDEATGARLAGRFKAKGQPVFLVHDLASGLKQGDIMRFQDKAALIDADVWQTLQAEGALEKLQAAPLVRVTAKGSETAWLSRAKQVKASEERMAYAVGAELIKVLQENFGGVPGRQQFTMTFDGANLQLLAPKEWLDQLKVVQVVKAPVTGRPRFISPPPAPKLLAGENFYWQMMAVDPAEPDGKLRYRVVDALPPGLAFDPEMHAIKGRVDSAGLFAVRAEVRNSLGAQDTLSFVIEAAANRAPALAMPPKPMAFVGKPWSFAVQSVDPDHPGDAIKVQPKTLPPGMSFDSVARVFSWTPAPELAGKSGEFSLTLSDPLQAQSEHVFTLQVREASDLAWSQDIRVDLPFDTLIQGRLYTWKPGLTAMVWAEQGVKLHAVIGPDSTNYDGESLALRPRRSGTHDLLFQFQTSGGIIQQAISLPVKQDAAPYFASALSTDRIAVGQKASYQPVAIDPEGEGVTLEAYMPEGQAWRFENGRLEIDGDAPGLHVARLIARDPSGHWGIQWVSMQVEPAHRPMSWHIENRIQGGLAAWIAAVDFGMGRLGLFTPTLFDALSFNGRSGRDWPYLFFGGNLLGHASELKGNRLFADLGFTMRLPDPKIATGGVYGRLQGEWTFPELAFSRIETEFTGHVYQALVLTDTTGIRFIFGEEGLEAAGKYEPIVRRIMDDATAKDNAVFFTRIEAFARLGWGFFAGPAAWREDFPMDKRFLQHVGGVLRYQPQWRSLLGQANMRMGWGPGGAGFDLYASWRMSFGAPF